MKYRLVYTKRAKKDIRKLDGIAIKQLGKAMLKFIQNPLSYAGKLVDHKIGEYRWRIDNYRVIFDRKESEIVILRVGHRKEIYQ